VLKNFKIFESSINKQWFYHATKIEYLSSIFRNGLTPNTEKKSNFEASPDIQYSKNKVFVTESFQRALFYGSIINKDTNDFIPILRVQLNKKELQRDYIGESYDWYSEKKIDGPFEIWNDEDEWLKLTEDLVETIECYDAISVVKEGYSNVNGLTQIIRDKIDTNWNRIIKREGKTNFTFNFQDPQDKSTKSVIVKFDPISRENFMTLNVTGYDYKVVISTKDIRDLEKSKNNLIGSLVHELTHISQEFNKFHSHEFKIRRIQYKERLKDNPKLKYKDFYDFHHDVYETEKEAVMMKLFELLRRKDLDRSINFCYDNSEYFDLYSYKKLVNKSYFYGVNINDFNLFREELTKMLYEMINKFMNVGDDSKYDLIKKCYFLGKQFNIKMREKILTLYNSFKLDEPNSYLNYNVIKSEIDNMKSDRYFL
jgi:hypothetical protein